MTFLIESLAACALFFLLGMLVKYVNGCTTFWGGALTAYALWNVVNWFHIRGSLIGMLLAIPSALIAGLIVII